MKLPEFQFYYASKLLESAKHAGCTLTTYSEAMRFCHEIIYMAKRKMEIKMLIERDFNNDTELDFIVVALLEYTDWDRKKLSHQTAKELIKGIFR